MSKERYDRERMARRVKSLRADKGWDQGQLAENAGVSKDTVVSVETARRGIGLDMTCALADALGCTLDELVCRECCEPVYQFGNETPVHRI